MKGYAAIWPLFLLLPMFAYFFAYVPEANPPEEVSHLYLARAMIEQGSFRIGEQIKAEGDHASKVVFEGETFSDRAPGLAILSVPSLGVAELLAHLRGHALSLRGALWWLRLTMASIPAAVFFIWLHFFLIGAGVRPLAARLSALTGALSLPLFFAATTFGSEAFGAMLLLVAWIILRSSEDWPGPVRFALAGAFAGAAAVCDYSMLPPLIVFSIYALARARRPRWVAPYFVVVVIWLALLAGYHFACFGSPFTTPMSAAGSGWWVNWHPALGRLGHTLVAPGGGLLTLAPIWIFVLIGFVAMLSRGDATEVLVFVALVASQAIIISGMRAVNNDPLLAWRLLSPLAIFCLIPLARGIDAAESIAGATFVVGLLAVSSIATSVLLAPYLSFLPADASNNLRDFVWFLFRDGVVTPNAGRFFGLPGTWTLMPLAVIAFCVMVIVSLGGVVHESGAARRALAIIALAWSAVLWRTTWQPDTHRQHRVEQALAIEHELQVDTVFARGTQGGDPIRAGVEATSRGNNAQAIEDYRPLFK